MMRPAALLDLLTARGVTAEPVDGKLRCRPRGAITPEVRRVVRKHGRALLRFLREQAAGAAAVDATESHADLEARRFWAVAVPHRDGSGYFDPVEAGVVAVTHALRQKPKPRRPHQLPGPPPELYPKPGGGMETFQDRAIRYRQEWKTAGYPPGIAPISPDLDS